MFDFNGLYRSVFRLTADRFDPNRNYYTVLINYSDKGEPFEGYYKQLSESLNLHIHDDALFELTFSGSDSAYDIKTRLEDVKLTEDNHLYNTYGVDSPRYNYVVVCHASRKDEDITYIKELFEVISKVKRPMDNTVFVLTLPDKITSSTNEAKEILTRITEVIPLYTYNYLFTAFENSAFRCQALVDSAVGAIIMNAFIQEVSSHNERRGSNDRRFNSYLKGLDETGLKYYDTLSPIYWSSLYCKYFDKKRDFLLWYCVELGKNVRWLTFEDCEKIMNTCYDAAIPTKSGSSAIEALVRAMEMVPGTAKPQGSKESISLSTYFERLYRDGSSTKNIELSLKATMSMLGNDPVDDAVQVTAKHLLESCAEFNTAKLKEDVVEHIRRVISILTADRQKMGKNLEEDFDTPRDSGIANAFRDYASLYLKLYQLDIKIRFWNDVVTCIVEGDLTFKDIYDAASERYNDIKNMDNLLTASAKGAAYNVKKIPSLTPIQILSAKTNEQLCRDIATSFSAVAQDDKGVKVPSDISPVFDIPFVPNTYSDFEINFKNASYLIVGTERNGKYLTFLNEENANV